ncbi:MAG TPA: NADH-quinone oxidoreductase subunit C, partial [Anaerolineae bacterium]|nr:NADH-quinone oxidoreductase subunit C [Anaerolineae bacterium]
MSDRGRPEEGGIVEELQGRFGPDILAWQETRDDMPTLWAAAYAFRDVLRHLKTGIPQPYRTVYDLTAVDERSRSHRADLPEADFTVVYTLRSYVRNADLRLKVPLQGDYPLIPTITDLWPAANWYEREAWDMFGITFEGHPNLRRILMPPGWKGHPLRKEHPARATEMGPFRLPEAKQQAEMELLQFEPEEWGMERRGT